MSSILFTGDFYPFGRILNLQIEEVYNDFLSVIQDSDLAITNLESPLCRRNLKKLDKKGPHLRADLDKISYVKDGGFSLVTSIQ